MPDGDTPKRDFNKMFNLDGSGDAPRFDPVRLSAATKKRTRDLVFYIEQRQAEIENLKDDIKEVYITAKAQGYNVRALKDVVKHRKKDITDDERDDQRDAFDLIWDILHESASSDS